jgi:L-lactate dehydrogenase complex protein LldE
MKAALFVPCLMDRFLPDAGMAAARLLESVGVRVVLDSRQTCCGQPAVNAGHPDLARRMASRMLRLADHGLPVVVPSGSCVAMVRDGYGMLDLPGEEGERWLGLRGRIFELAEFLESKGLIDRVSARLEARVVVHHACHHLRHVRGEGPLRSLLGRLSGAEVVDSPQARQCCGFGGVFSTRLPELSIAMGRARLDAMLGLEPRYVALADAGCILHLSGIVEAQGLRPELQVVHYAQLFTGDGLALRDRDP